MPQVGGTWSSRVWFRNFFFLFKFNLLWFIANDILQTMMAVSTLYLFPFSRYLKKKTYFWFVRECSSVIPFPLSSCMQNKKQTCFRFILNYPSVIPNLHLTLKKAPGRISTHAGCSTFFSSAHLNTCGALHIFLRGPSFGRAWSSGFSGKLSNLSHKTHL